MHIDFAFVCDYADSTGKLDAIGIGFDTVYASHLPAQLPSFFFVAQIRCSITEVGEKDFGLRLIDADGGDVTSPLEGRINILPPEPGGESLARIVVRFQGVAFPKYGAYALHLTVQGNDLARIPIRVAPPPTTA